MPGVEWVIKSESLEEIDYGVKGATTEYLRECTLDENSRLNYSLYTKFGVGKQVPRIGFYIIKDLYLQKKFQSDQEEEVAIVAFKENLEDRFMNVGISIRTQPLFNFVSVCNDKQKYKSNHKGLINKEIQIKSCDLVDTVYNGVASKSYKVVWIVKR